MKPNVARVHLEDSGNSSYQARERAREKKQKFESAYRTELFLRMGETRRTRHVPLNDEALRVLKQWREQSGPGKQVFQVAACFKTAWSHVLERAGIAGFRWHDLLGQASVAMSLRYAHLAPDQRCKAVAHLDKKPLLSVSLSLPWVGPPTAPAG
jgi:integrase